MKSQYLARSILYLIFSSSIFYVQADDSLSSLGKSIYGSVKSIVHTVGSGKFWKGVGRSFGASPSGYTMSFDVYNSSHLPVYVGLKGIASFMGAYFPSAKGMYDVKKIDSILSYSGSDAPKVSYSNEEFYFDLYVSSESDPSKDPAYYKNCTQLSVKHDPKTYYYHAYTKRYISEGSYVHGLGCELLGFSNPSAKGDAKGNITISSQLSSLTLYNSLGVDVSVSLQYGSKNMTITLEKYSYNTMTVPMDTSSSTPTPKFSLRPNTLTFTTLDAAKTVKTLKLPSQGFDGYTYVVEVFQDPGQNINVGIQGLNPGHYDQGVTSRLRDITPCPVVFWYQSVKQMQDNQSQGLVDLPGQVWMVYQGADSPMKTKVEPGQAVGWNLFRPLAAQGDQQLVFLYIETSEDKVAEAFVDDFIAGHVGSDVMHHYQTKLMQFAKDDSSQQLSGSLSLQASEKQKNSLQQESVLKENIATLLGQLNVAQGRMLDKKINVVGYLLGVDIFTPKGLGLGNYYYVLSPSISNIQTLAEIVSSSVDQSKLPDASNAKKSASNAITLQVEQWLKDYIDKPHEVAKEVMAYLEKYGKSKILNSDNALNALGKARLKSIVFGNVSLEYPPMKLSTVSNQYVFDFGKNKPKNLPEVTQIS